MKVIVASILSFFILLSSSGLAYAQHFCLGHAMLSKVTLGEESLSCQMAMDYSACDDESGEEHSCCSNEYLQVDTDDHFAKVSFDFQLEYHWIALAQEPLASAPALNPGLATKLLPFERPPPLRVKRQVLFQTFLL